MARVGKESQGTQGKEMHRNGEKMGEGGKRQERIMENKMRGEEGKRKTLRGWGRKAKEQNEMRWRGMERKWEKVKEGRIE